MKKVFLFLVVVVSGCSMNPSLDEASSLIDNADNCCADYSEMEYDELQSGEAINFRIDENSDLYEFDTGKSFFKAFSLPAENNITRISIKSFFKGDVFYPVISVLDSRYGLKRIISHPTIKYHEPTFFESGYIGGEFSLEEDDAYLIIYTLNTLIGGTQISTDSGSGYFVNGVYVFSPPSSFTHNYTYVGDIRFEIK